MEVVGSEVWPEGAIEPWIVVQFGPWAVVVTVPEVGAVVAIVPQVWVVAVIGVWVVMTEHWVELVTEFQVAALFGSVIWVPF